MACKQYTYNIDAGDTQVIFSVSPYNFSAQKFVLTVSDEASSRKYATELFVSYSGDQAAPVPDFIRYAAVGSEIDYDFSIAYNASTEAIEISVTNLETGSLRFDLSEHGTVI